MKNIWEWLENLFWCENPTVTVVDWIVQSHIINMRKSIARQAKEWEVESKISIIQPRTRIKIKKGFSEEDYKQAKERLLKKLDWESKNI